jgi:DNA-binding XRE family transcriptional regulator
MTYVVVCQEWDILKEKAKGDTLKYEKETVICNNVPSFGYLLQQARIHKRLTTTDLANNIGIESRSISLYESGIETPSAEIAEKLRLYLDI